MSVAMGTTSSVIPVKRDTQLTATEFVKVLYLCIQFPLPHSLVTYKTVIVNFPIMSLGLFTAFDVHEI